MNRKIVISLSSIILLFLMSGVVFASDFRLGKHFADHTFIGPFNISNNKTKQAKLELASDFSDLQSQLEVNLIYQDIQFSLPSETIKFDIDMTLANANSGEDNPIIANVSRDGLTTVLQQELPWVQFTEESIDLVAAGIEGELQTGIMPRNVYITDYLGTNVVPAEVVASSKLSIEGISPVLSKALHEVDQSIIGPLESFSMLEVLTSSEVGQLTDEELTLLSSIMYTATLQTNFQIDERNISAVIPSEIQTGFEAAMNQTLGLDFKFTNPNKTEFTIRANWTAGMINVSLEGLPLYYTYEPSITTIETYKPRTVRQYSAFINNGEVVVSQEGKDGVEAVVKRTLSVDGKVVDTEDISEDFYAPIHRVEIHPLSNGDASVTEKTNSDEVNLPQGEETPSDIDTETSNPVRVEEKSAGNVDEAGIEESAPSEIIYDKSGLPISGK